MGVQDLDRWPGLSTEPPRQPDKQPSVDILLLNRRERERTSKGCLATGLQPLRQENQGGDGERYSPPSQYHQQTENLVPEADLGPPRVSRASFA